MKRSLALALHLLLNEQAVRGDAQTERPSRPAGRLAWLHAGTGGLAALRQIAEALFDRGGIGEIVVTADGTTAPEMTGFPDGVMGDADPGDRLTDVRGFLAHWAPDAVVVAGSMLPAAIVAETADRGIPLLLIEYAGPGTGGEGFFGRSVARSLLPRFDRIFAPDAESALRIRTILGADAQVRVTGRIVATNEPLVCDEDAYEDLSSMIGTRQVWCAIGCPMDELDAVLAAHEHAQRLSHRMLLILVPDNPVEAEAMLARAGDYGHVAALASAERNITEDIQVVIADGPSDDGLWYRLAPLTYLGGTLNGSSGGRNPLEPAALGSAVIVGAKLTSHRDEHARLAEARAVRVVRNAAALSDAVADLTAPDRAALLAHNAWVAVSSGAEAASIVADEIDALVRARAAPKAGQ